MKHRYRKLLNNHYETLGKQQKNIHVLKLTPQPGEAQSIEAQALKRRLIFCLIFWLGFLFMDY